MRGSVTAWLVVTLSASALVAVLSLSLATRPLQAVDRLGAEHVMPGLESDPVGFGLNEQGEPRLFVTPAHPRYRRAAHYVWGPFSRLLSSLLLGVLGLYAWLRRRTLAVPLAWLACFGLANLAAYLMQAHLRRPPLRLDGPYGSYELGAYVATFPSGYTVRAVFCLLVVWALSRRAGYLALPVVAAVLAAIVTGGSHLPTDVVAGVAIAVAAYGLSCLFATPKRGI